MKAIRLVVAALCLFATPALACTEVNAPTTLSSPGLYCLTANIYQSTPNNNGLTVTSPGVTLEMRGLTIFGPGTGTGNGIYVAPGAHDFAARNGQVTQFMYGIRAEQTNNIRIRDVDASYNSFRGFSVHGSGAWILYSRVFSITGYPAYPDSYAFGIEVVGQNCVIAFNSTGNMQPLRVGEGVHISLSDNNAGCSVYNNVIRQDNNPTYGSIFAIWGGTTDATNSIHNNIIVGALYGINVGTPTLVNGNIVLTACATYWSWQSPTYQQNNREIPGECPDTIEELTIKTQEEPNRGEWWYRLAFNVKNRTGDLQAAKQHYQTACGLGIPPACSAAAGIP